MCGATQKTYRSLPLTRGECDIAALNAVLPQKIIPARDEMLKLGPHLASRQSVKDRQISSRQLLTRLMAVSGVKPCVSSTLVMWSMKTDSGSARGKSASMAFLCLFTSKESSMFSWGQSHPAITSNATFVEQPVDMSGPSVSSVGLRVFGIASGGHTRMAQVALCVLSLADGFALCF